jgi:hypothetical protein
MDASTSLSAATAASTSPAVRARRTAVRPAREARSAWVGVPVSSEKARAAST